MSIVLPTVERGVFKDEFSRSEKQTKSHPITHYQKEDLVQVLPRMSAPCKNVRKVNGPLREEVSTGTAGGCREKYRFSIFAKHSTSSLCRAGAHVGFE